MFEKLKQRWKVNSWNLFLVISTFALGGSFCGYLGRKILMLFNLEKGAVWVILYIVLITLLWPLCVLLVSIPLGQFPFFRNYISRIMGKMGNASHSQKITRIAIFASGAGSNAQNIIRYFSNNPEVKIDLVVCNNPSAGVLHIAKENNIPILIIDKKSLNDPFACQEQIQVKGINLIILAGFLWKIPEKLIAAFPERIINIHPALLPNYGGKGMYGKHVHEAVIANAEKQSGISIHLVDEHYDHGKVLFQATCTIDSNDTPEMLAAKIHSLEQAHFPKVIHDYIKTQNHR